MIEPATTRSILSPMNRAPWVFKLAAAALGACAAAALAIGGARLARRVLARPPLCRKCDGCPYVYELNPARGDVGPQGLRDRAYAVPKPPGRKRILVLGDSVAYGEQVAPGATFPKVLEARLDGVDVINSGVPGWSPYNELHYYLARGRSFQPDLVIVAMCLNDVVDPAIHWRQFTRDEIPKEAIPNPSRRIAQPDELPSLEHGGRTWPVFLTTHDDVTIQVLLDRQSPEWRWLAGIYRQ